MNRFKRAAALLLAALCLLALGCQKSESPKGYRDGVYTGRSSDFAEDESGNGAGYGEVTLEIRDKKIVACTFKMYELDGTLKDETYGADLSKENRLKAQKAVQSADKYAQMLLSAGSLEGVDAISGATISHKEFSEAVERALAQAAITQ